MVYAVVGESHKISNLRLLIAPNFDSILKFHKIKGFFGDLHFNVVCQHSEMFNLEISTLNLQIPDFLFPLLVLLS